MLKLFRIVPCIVGLLALAACSDNQDLLNPGNNESLNAQSDPIIEKARQAYEMCYGNTSRSTAMFTQNNVIPITRLSSRATTTDTILYIVNESDGRGFVALTGGLRPEILAVSDNGTIRTLEEIDNPGLKMFFDAATLYAANLPKPENLTAQPVEPFPKFKEEILYETKNCAPRCITKWGQQYPEGMFCPNRYSGCTITATVQALSYFKAPSEIALTYADADKPIVTLDWDNMIKSVESQSWYQYGISTDRTPTQIENEQNLGRICRELGIRMAAGYLTDGTYASLRNMADVVSQICPTLKVEGRYLGAPIASKDLGDGVIIMQGSRYASEQDKNNNNHDRCSAHAWIVDGFEYNATHHRIYVYNSATGNYDYSETESYSEVEDLQHINWGWRGYCNGYFKLNVFNTGSPTKPDTNNNSISYNYDHSFSYFKIYPK